MRRKKKYHRCKKCKQLVSDPNNCGSCANPKNPLSATTPPWREGKRGSPTLDIQEGNSEESF